MDELDTIIENELYYLNVIFPNLKIDENIYNIKIEKIKNNIIKSFKNRISENIIIERIIHNDHCIHRIKRGKHDINNHDNHDIHDNYYKKMKTIDDLEIAQELEKNKKHII